MISVVLNPVVKMTVTPEELTLILHSSLRSFTSTSSRMLENIVRLFKAESHYYNGVCEVIEQLKDIDEDITLELNHSELHTIIRCLSTSSDRFKHITPSLLPAIDLKAERRLKKRLKNKVIVPEQSITGLDQEAGVSILDDLF